MKIEEGLLKCSACKGTGEDGVYVCQKCQGKGVTDWVTNAMAQIKKPLSSLQLINIRRLMVHVRKTIENAVLERIDLTTQNIETILDDYKSQRALYDYKVDKISRNEFNVFIKPTRTVEIIEMNFEITRSGEWME